MYWGKGLIKFKEREVRFNMKSFLIKRLLLMVPTLLIISIIAFAIIQLPPGSYVNTLVSQLAQSGHEVSQAQIQALEQRYGINRPIYAQYYIWMRNIILNQDFGYSFIWQAPVNRVIGSRLMLTIIVSSATLFFTWLVALPIGIISAVKQYSLTDYSVTFIGFLGLSIPNFMLALVLMFIGFRYFGISVGGLFSEEYLDASWSIARFLDMLKHLWIPVIVVGTARTAGLIRIMRANLLDELHKPYVVSARAKGVAETVMLIKYPVRVAINPLLSSIGWMLPQIISGVTITAIVLSLPTVGPALLDALMAQDMYLAGTFILLISFLTVVGTLLSDILLALADPRIRYE